MMNHKRKTDWLTAVFCTTIIAIGIFEATYLSYLFWNLILKG